MIPSEIYKLKDILDSFLGRSKNELTESYQLQYSCPRCRELKGTSENRKFNLECNLRLGVFKCWSCSSHDDDMHGSLKRLIKLYGNEDVYEAYKETIYSLRQSKLFELNFNKEDFNIDKSLNVIDKEFELPSSFTLFNKNGFNNKKALDYLFSRNIGWDIIEKYNIGYTKYDENNKQVSSRIIIPSYNEFNELDYWTGRDFTSLSNRQKYFNPKIERKNLIFNEGLINWDADITLVEGPFDHIVVPNSIPLLGKALKEDFKLYQTILEKCNANINIWLDNDCPDDIIKIYSLLNHGRLHNKIRVIDTNIGKDPSDVYKDCGKKGIIYNLKQTTKIDEIKLI